MAVLYRAVNLTNELKKQVILKDLEKMGIVQYNGKPIHEMDYYEARHALVMERLKKEGN